MQFPVQTAVSEQHTADPEYPETYLAKGKKYYAQLLETASQKST